MVFASAFPGQIRYRNCPQVVNQAVVKLGKYFCLFTLQRQNFGAATREGTVRDSVIFRFAKGNKISEPIVRDLWDPTYMTSTKTDLKERFILLTA